MEDELKRMVFRKILVVGLLGIVLVGCSEPEPEIDFEYRPEQRISGTNQIWPSALKVISKEQEPIVISGIKLNGRYIASHSLRIEYLAKSQIDEIEAYFAPLKAIEHFKFSSYEQQKYPGQRANYGFHAIFPYFSMPIEDKKVISAVFPNHFASSFVKDTLKFGETYEFVDLGSFFHDPDASEWFRGELLTVEVQTNRGTILKTGKTQ